ncbi:hypothetical protein LNKW23_28270 [Paralimibaculum aggregatum]|uniref:Mechanosensitive ion channel protein MscS n=1 Tax=Paralimibaculum aggregatum TaxID=3036245 RepID=A0ABQ6LK41_9RHOB|nr:mechanosensitive ion channel family protein [Limibaculum sp. NKW23]GMG83614.1 hypothetical protein LNKW23_28270 [Limibaculum sp. NKW23]
MTRLRTGTGAGIGAAALLLGALVLAALLLALPGARPAGAQAAAPALAIEAARTDSPRATLASFLSMRSRMAAALTDYATTRDRRTAARIGVLSEEWRSLIDLSEVPRAARLYTGGETGAHLIDIFNRIGWPDPALAPDASAVPADGPASYAIPGTPFRIRRMETGSQAGEFLFDRRTVDLASRVYGSVEHLPPVHAGEIRDWIDITRQLTGPMIPSGLIAAMPPPLRQPLAGTPRWKVLAVLAAAAVAALLLLLWHRLVTPRDAAIRQRALWRRLLSPLAIIGAVILLHGFFTFQINIAGSFARGVGVVRTVLLYGALTWAFWLFARALLEAMIVSPRLSDQSLDANMLRLLARIVGVIGGIVLLANGAQDLGLPVFSILAGLGIGGIAIALAIRPTLENLIGGFILYLDRPIRVGDFCSFGNHSGTVEAIGVRSTQVRALDRTLISIPNAQFADMQLVNWARCDTMLIQEVLGLRYETGHDQLRYVLAKIREMAHAHPRIEGDTIRVRLVSFGASSLDIELRVYAETREWNDYYAIKEDILLRIREIVEAAGTGFAFPTQTLHLGRDTGLDAARAAAAERQVGAWRRSGRLPFPRFDAATVAGLAGSLAYPPPGSPEARGDAAPGAGGAEERLSAAPAPPEPADPPAGDEPGAPDDGTTRHG